jgi:5-methylcytosine-specific restriction protein A
MIKQKWTRKELKAAVDVYMEMKELELKGQSFGKTKYYSDLGKRFGRTPSTFKLRMYNISHVYSLLGKELVKGIKPLPNVGRGTLPIIIELIQENEKESFDKQVSIQLKQQKKEKPTGNKSPKKQFRYTTLYERDPRVVAWILNNSKGKCENCNNKAPFKKSGDEFYLEVHHIKRLADGGSDKTQNAIAVCPNCHRELHYGKDKNLLVNKLYQNIERLVKE